MTINQTLDQIFIQYKNKDLNQYPAIQKLKMNLTELKLTFGGNTQVENEDTIQKVIESGSANPDDWK
jgi:hypothetical protein